ncbi:MAG: DUF393 domain-containing protein [Bdellovibrionaceae bacterium]|nr:DUF393 domain-containing protein [Pseudobdellovibrionaceae bacterium]
MKILFFDGYCSLCNYLVDWGMARDKREVILFSSLQGETAKKVIPQYILSDSDTVVYWRDNRTYERSSAILYLLGDIGWPWKAALIFFVVPRFLRDTIYQWVSRNRYRFFKKQSTCRMPTTEEKTRLLP